MHGIQDVSGAAPTDIERHTKLMISTDNHSVLLDWLVKQYIQKEISTTSCVQTSIAAAISSLTPRTVLLLLLRALLASSSLSM